MMPDSEITSDGGSATTAGAANATTTTIIIPAPGAAYRIRVYHLAISHNQNSTGDLQCRFDDGTGLNGQIAVLGSTAGNVGVASWYPQGIALPPNTPLTMRDRCSAAAQGFLYEVHYILEFYA